MPAELPALVVGAGFLLALVWEDFASFRLPDKLSVPGVALTLAAAGVSSAVYGHADPAADSAAGAAAICNRGEMPS